MRLVESLNTKAFRKQDSIKRKKDIKTVYEKMMSIFREFYIMNSFLQVKNLKEEYENNFKVKTNQLISEYIKKGEYNEGKQD